MLKAFVLSQRSSDALSFFEAMSSLQLRRDTISVMAPTLCNALMTAHIEQRAMRRGAVAVRRARRAPSQRCLAHFRAQSESQPQRFCECTATVTKRGDADAFTVGAFIDAFIENGRFADALSVYKSEAHSHLCNKVHRLSAATRSGLSAENPSTHMVI